MSTPVEQEFQEVLEKAFKKYDINGDGFIDEDELQAALQTSKADVSRAEVQRLIQAVGGNHGKRIAFTEFYALHSSFVNSVFDGFDVNGDGRVCIKDIVQGLFKLGIPCSTAKAEKLLKKSDAKENGHLTREDFFRLYQRMYVHIIHKPAVVQLLFDPDLHRFGLDWAKTIEAGEGAVKVPVQQESSHAALVGGLLAGPIEAMLLQPTDVCKTRMQLSNTSHGMWATGRNILKTEGVGALWKGVGPFSTHLALKYCLRWGSATYFKNMLRDKNGHLTSGRNFVAGAMAGGLEAVLVVTPFEVIKTRLQIQKGQSQYKGPVDCCIKVLKQEGPRALWRGLTPTFCRNTINQATNQTTKPLFDKYMWGFKRGDPPPAVWKTAVSGCFAGILGPLLNNPMDVAKTRLMAGNPKYTSTLNTIVTIAREEGVPMLWKGYLARLSRLGPGYAIQWAVLDMVQKAWAP